MRRWSLVVAVAVAFNTTGILSFKFTRHSIPQVEQTLESESPGRHLDELIRQYEGRYL